MVAEQMEQLISVSEQSMQQRRCPQGTRVQSTVFDQHTWREDRSVHTPAVV